MGSRWSRAARAWTFYLETTNARLTLRRRRRLTCRPPQLLRRPEAAETVPLGSDQAELGTRGANSPGGLALASSPLPHRDPFGRRSSAYLKTKLRTAEDENAKLAAQLQAAEQASSALEAKGREMAAAVMKLNEHRKQLAAKVQHLKAENASLAQRLQASGAPAPAPSDGEPKRFPWSGTADHALTHHRALRPLG